ncbi:M56 family metallopeptidase [Runella slithyformis]|uniref:Peptidase M56 BlaR1 n=1 Tax=Runella slithyformis (strain ATCC 29530 / DSM 19594 / LMG 11500 / NCIMB 11436 / LSU 4) TaxID=761193 RepID=A0A7U3ZHJ9_RUNSL|nr:M56 family metallopeptidase [Runella slithyformis]AEI47348.1 peptidase M56 BlaR1 [Runella slithyformis DSM 19594]
MKLFSISSEPLIQAFGWMLLHAVWQGFAVALIAAGLLFLLRRRASYSRYWTGIGALVLQVMASATTFALYYQPRVLQTTLPGVTHLSQPFITKGSQVMVALPWYKQTLWFLQSNLEAIVLFWVIGASVLLLRLVGSWVYVQQLKAEGIRLTESRIQEMFRRIVATLNIRATVHLFESVRVSTPVVIGFIRPVVLLPVGLATGLTAKQIEAILAHELAHVKRFDYLVNLLQSLVEVVYFFHPALWWVSSRVRMEREHCCDDIAIEVCGDKLAFARALAEVETFRQSPALAMAFASQKGLMLQRVRRVLGVTEKPSRRMSPNALILLVLLVFGVSVYAFQPTDKPRQHKPKNTIKVLKDKVHGTRIEMDENFRLLKIMWKDRILSTLETAHIQKLREQVNAGTLNLDNVKNQEQRDILLYIIEKENELHDGLKGMVKGFEGLSEALGEININTEDLAHIIDSVKVDGKWVQTNNFVQAVSLNMPFDDKKMQEHHRRIDSLSRLMEPQHQKMEALRLEMEQHEFKVNELERKMELLEWKKNKAAEERSQVLEKRSQLMYRDGQKVKKAEAEMEKELEQFEGQIRQRETQMQQINQQIGELREQMKTVRRPLADLQAQMEKVERINEELSQKMEAESSAIELMTPPEPPMPVEVAPRVRVRTPKAAAAPARVKESGAPRTPKAASGAATPAPVRKK